MIRIIGLYDELLNSRKQEFKECYIESRIPPNGKQGYCLYIHIPTNIIHIKFNSN